MSGNIVFFIFDFWGEFGGIVKLDLMFFFCGFMEILSFIFVFKGVYSVIFGFGFLRLRIK